MKDQGVVIAVTVREDKGAQGSDGKGWCNLHDDIIF